MCERSGSFRSPGGAAVDVKRRAVHTSFKGNKPNSGLVYFSSHLFFFCFKLLSKKLISFFLLRLFGLVVE